MNFLKRNIAIWYKDEDWAKSIFEFLLNNFNASIIFKINREEFTIFLKDESIIKFINNQYSARGFRIDQLYVQKGITLDEYNHVARLSRCSRLESYVVDQPIQFLYKKSVKDYFSSPTLLPNDEEEVKKLWKEQEQKDAEKTTLLSEERKE